MRKKKTTARRLLPVEPSPQMLDLVNRISATAGADGAKAERANQAIEKSILAELPDALRTADDQQIRAFFAMILATCSVANGKKIIKHCQCPNDLASEFKTAMSLD